MTELYAVIIKHPGRDWEGDVRIDLYEVPNDTPADDVRREAQIRMLGPFEVVYVTQKINLTKHEGLTYLEARRMAGGLDETVHAMSG